LTVPLATRAGLSGAGKAVPRALDVRHLFNASWTPKLMLVLL
jgi:hypothetical protein